MGRRAGAVVAAGLLALISACGTATGETQRRPGQDAGLGSGGSARAEGPSALDDPRHSGFPDPLIDLGHLVSGGPPPDGIAPIDAPKVQLAREVDWLEAEEPVLALTIAEESRAYPLQVMTWHEIVNDTGGGVPVAVTYCPLCNSGVAFERQVGGRMLSFGTSGMLYADNLVMYDRQTESLWPQLTGQASVGVLTGTRLEAIPIGVVGWEQFRSAHPDALLLTRDTGHDRDYGRNPYAGYDPPTAPCWWSPRPGETHDYP